MFASAVMLAPGIWDIGDDLVMKTTLDSYSDNAVAAVTINADLLHTGGGSNLDLDGSAVTVGLWESGSVRDTHTEFQITGGGSRVTLVDTGAAITDHATHVAGTIGARGDDATAKGMAPNVTIVSRDSANDAAEIAADAGVIDLSNHSYGMRRGWNFDGNAFVNIPVTFGTFPCLADTYLADPVANPLEDPNVGKYENTRNAVDLAIGSTVSLPSEIDETAFKNPKLLSVWSAGNERNDVFNNAINICANDIPPQFRLAPLDFYDQWYIAFNNATGAFSVYDGTINPPPANDGNGGTGFDNLVQAKVAKNSLVVGAVTDFAVGMTNFSSWGPTDDGRIKPDVVANGFEVHSSVAYVPGSNPRVASDSSYNGDPTNHGDLDVWNGTSMATPSVTGAAALLLEHYRDLNNIVRNLTAGDHDIRVEYYEDVDEARLALTWARPEVAKSVVPASVLWHDSNPQVAGLDAEYFDFSTTLSDIPDFTGLTPDITNVATQLNFFSETGHWAGLTSDYDDTFAARYTGTIKIAETDDYAFSLNADNKARLWIDDVLVIDDPRSATLKGLILHTAQDATIGVATVGPDYSTGWGVVDAAAAANFLTGSMPGTGHTTDLFEQTYDGTEWQYHVRTDGNDPLKVTIVWTDPAALALAA